MNFKTIAGAISDHDLSEEDVQEIAESVGLAYAEAGAKRQHQEYEPDEVKTGLVAPVPDDQTQNATVAVLQELCWENVEKQHLKRKESYVREDD